MPSPAETELLIASMLSNSIAGRTAAPPACSQARLNCRCGTRWYSNISARLATSAGVANAQRNCLRARGMDVADWLREIGLEQYSRLFAEHDISGEILPHLTAEDLKDLGITLIGHRRRLLVATETLRDTMTRNDARRPRVKRFDATSARSLELGTSAERRQMSVLFCDIVGSTELIQRGSTPRRCESF